MPKSARQSNLFYFPDSRHKMFKKNLSCLHAISPIKIYYSQETLPIPWHSILTNDLPDSLSNKVNSVAAKVSRTRRWKVWLSLSCLPSSSFMVVSDKVLQIKISHVTLAIWRCRHQPHLPTTSSSSLSILCKACFKTFSLVGQNILYIRLSRSKWNN